VSKGERGRDSASDFCRALSCFPTLFLKVRVASCYAKARRMATQRVGGHNLKWRQSRHGVSRPSQSDARVRQQDRCKNFFLGRTKYKQRSANLELISKTRYKFRPSGHHSIMINRRLIISHRGDSDRWGEIWCSSV
jgi:hypothetical protein